MTSATNERIAASTAAVAPADAFVSRNSLQLVGLGMVLYSFGPVIARATEAEAVLISFWRLWFGVMFFACAAVLSVVRGQWFASSRGLRLAMLAGVCFSMNQVMFVMAIQRTSVVDVTLVGTLSPIIVALLAIPAFDERPTARFRMFSLVAVAGAVFVVIASSAGPQGDPVGMALAFGSTSIFACFFILSKLARPHISVVGYFTVAMFVAALIVTIFVAATGREPQAVGSADMWRALGIAFVPGTLGHITSTAPLRFLPANVPPLMRLMGPVVAGLLAWMILGEGFTWVHVVGGAVIIAALAAAILSRDGRELISQAQPGRGSN